MESNKIVPIFACVMLYLGTTGAVNAQAKERPLLKLQEVPFTQVQIRDGFWEPRRETNRRVSLPHSLEMLEKSGNIHNLELAAAEARKDYIGPVFSDSDLYKVIESVSFSLATNPDPVLDRQVDAVIAKMAKAQRPNGYLDTWYEVNAPDQTFTNLRDNHELYCAGHLFEAATAHFRATGKRNLLNIATKYADYLASVFGPGKRKGYPGHPEIELALIKLWRVTGEKRYFELAKFFIENRGSKFFAEEHHTPLEQYDGNYWQDNCPIREQKSIVGHAVRATYLMSGVVDVAGETQDSGLLKMVDRVWRNTTQKNMYVTGGIGPSASNEGFTTDYDLPNLTAYQETCASVAMTMWNHRLNLLYGDARYADLMELALYNGVLAGVSLDGKRFFYVNPLASTGNHHRSEWFSCACCPPNVTRTLASLGGYAYAASPDSLYVNLYIQGGVEAKVGAEKVALDVKTDYPWDGKVAFTVHPAAEHKFALRLRVPGWCSSATAQVNGVAQDAPKERGYLVLDRAWKPGDTVTLDLPMPVRRIEANPEVKDDRGRLALGRGPLIYCLEACDQKAALDTLALPADAPLTTQRASDLLGGIVTLQGEGLTAGEPDWQGGLYRTANTPARTPVRAVPYYAWDNRAPGAMEVWLPTAPPVPKVTGLEGRAQVSLSYRSGYANPQGIHDGIEPKSSGEQPAALCHWWPHKGGQEWVQYDWKTPIQAEGVKVYWFDDTGRGECRLPAGWKLLYKEGANWKPVTLTDPKNGFPVALDRWCEIHFTPVKTTAFRLEFTMQPNFAVGIHEWKILEPETSE